MKKRLFALALAGVLAAVTLTGCGSLKGDETVATVDDTKIDADLANFFARYTQATYETYYSAYVGEDMCNSDASDGETYEESVKSSVLKSLEDMILLEKHMEDYDVSITDEEAVNAFEYLSKTEGIIPAIESSHAIAYAMKYVPTLDKDKIVVFTVSGRGDKDVAAIARYRGVQIYE